MGSLTYDRVVVEFEDRMLAHLQLVIIQKLRRGESFLLSWRDAAVVGDGRSSAWLHPAIPLYFKFAGGHAPTINANWVAQLTRSANSSQGLVVTAEESASFDANLPPKVEPAIGIRSAAQTRATKASVTER
ncbi:ATP-dependent DNA ligase [Cryobacterium sp. PH31-O1]|uniref:DUF7882 family protein n=1 Tax=Cryobacterium sp. PH31-O1 TaxID=3046306 RepID=UPI0024BA87B4|nr:ATP-dependent DNA ligase [Cryobacterium sp. PH31-O1]MDJ0337515.1 ATP-dependent DNA ligase [Cryobacterium sp. PH31-O1]